MLDIGGAIHNLAKKLKYTGNLLIINSDQFIFMSPKRFKEILERMGSHSGILFAHRVKQEEKYNKLKLRKGLLLDEIVPHAIVTEAEYLTYTGMSIIKLDDLSLREGCSKFFDSVVEFKDKNYVIEDMSDMEYWDFGTVQQYFDNIHKLKNKTKSEFYHFLCNELEEFEQVIREDVVQFGEFTINKELIEYAGIKTKI